MSTKGSPNSGKSRKFRIFRDLLLFLLLLGIGLGALWFQRSHAGTGMTVVVHDSDTILFTLPLSEDTEHVIETPSGYNRLVIRNGSAWISEADCANQICVDHVPISVPGETIVCLPHKLVVEIRGAAE